MTFNFPEPDRPLAPEIVIKFDAEVNRIIVFNAKVHPKTVSIRQGLRDKGWATIVTTDESSFSVFDRTTTFHETMLLLKTSIEEAYEMRLEDPIVGGYGNGRTGDSLGCRDSVFRVVNRDGSVTTTTRTPLDRYPWFTETISTTGVPQ